ncbi:RNA polymerase-associated protein RapA [Pseudomarimonas salicorniae]|uniref:RNA polymerase-associated protein RapA n=1 Tax=Pseudomarimonas salicorniae TaxID=2933270 RepID=A0ABT0GKC0_9GAMM|nr:RNA polymerase-associated protein RapA [Lysobacter sp. CAU 1642]
MSPFVPGQRWFSTAEPELGLGTVMRVVARSVQIVFTGTGVVRQYAMTSAPLARANFRAGERIRIDGRELDVEEVAEAAGLLRYRGGSDWYEEGQLDAEQPVSKADSRLLGGRVDRNRAYEFRLESLRRRAQAQAHAGWGILGARIDLIPHQLRVAEIAAARRPPRLLLADEVGLGKTIEACLIVAQLLASGRASRTLILVPEALVHQWFVELLRRFNLRFAIFDEERCESMELGGDASNPFEDEQGVIAAIGWLAADDERREQLLEAGWDVLVVDEAHHLEWSPEEASPAYRLVEALAEKVPAVILLSATPEQLGRSGHFARLRLLDPARYASLETFLAESDQLISVSAAVESLLDGAAPDTAQREALAPLFSSDPESLARHLDDIDAASEERRALAVSRLVDELVDRHGVGRSMIRNRRAAVGGFPKRIKHLATLPAGEDRALLGRLLAEFLADVGVPGHAEPEHDYTRDPRLDWLLALLERIAPAKCLLLCRSRSKVQALEEALRLRSGLQVARFHEDMNLLQRDRNAAFFAQADGARLLIASEIGAEGRNFQFAQHLVLWDLPADPDMLEQRIGRLDRIGQRGHVQIHAAVVEGSPQQLLLSWFDEGLGAFEQVCADGRELLHEFGQDLIDLASLDADDEEQDAALAELVAATRARHAELSEAIQNGRDRLLEIASQRGAAKGRLLQALRLDDDLAHVDDYPLRLFEQFGVHNETIAPGVVLLDPEYLTLDAFEEFKDGPRQATLDRAQALARDDLLYLRPDHPMVLSAQELLLSAESGNAAFLVDDALPARTVVLEAVYVLECIADRALQVGRFLPPEPVVVAVDTRLQLREGFHPSTRSIERAADRLVDLQRLRKPIATLLPPMLKRAGEEATKLAGERAEQAAATADSLLGHEVERLAALARINPAVREDEIARLEAEREAVLAALPQARPRLDALRLVVSPDFLRLAS